MILQQIKSFLALLSVPLVGTGPLDSWGQAPQSVGTDPGLHGARPPVSRGQAPVVYDSFRPGQPWLDTDGKPIHAHGGSILRLDGRYWWYGENKERTDGKNGVWHWGVRAYSSTDLYNWKDEGLILPPEPDDPLSPLNPKTMMDRPHILFNERTRTFVCWLKLMQPPHAAVQVEAVYTASSIRGPWRKVRDGLRPCGMSAGDFDLVTADDGKAYYYFERVHSELVCADLTDDYTDVTGYYSTHFPLKRPPFTREAPAYFRRNGFHYLVTSGTTGYWPNPSRVAVADTFHGPWTVLGDLHPTDRSETSFRSQISSVFKVSDKKDLYIALGDRWLPDDTNTYATVSNAFDKATSGRGADADCQSFWKNFGGAAETCKARYVWLPIDFSGDKPAIKWHDEWKLEDFE